MVRESRSAEVARSSAWAKSATSEAYAKVARSVASKVPTAVSVTNKNEFALITVHDTQLKRGQVALLIHADAVACHEEQQAREDAFLKSDRW